MLAVIGGGSFISDLCEIIVFDSLEYQKNIDNAKEVDSSNKDK